MPEDHVAKTRSSQDQALTEGNYLDHHFEAARLVYQEMAHYAGFRPGWKLLDAGAGGGSYLPTLAEIIGGQGMIEAIDLAPENVAMIRQRSEAGEFACPVRARASSITSLPYHEQTFDGIWCGNVFQYLSQAEVDQALAEFKRVVRPGGLVALKDSDYSATLLGRRPITFWHFIERVQKHPEFGRQARAYLRATRYPELFAQLGLTAITYKTFLQEWRHPLSPEALPYLRTVMPIYGMIAAGQELPEEEAAFWRRFSDPDATDYYLNSPDFYYREAFGVTVGQRARQEG